MGIKSSFNKFLKSTDETIFKNIHISEYEYKKVAIDVTLFIYKFKVTSGSNWHQLFIELICVLRKNNIHPFFVFDGEYPCEKENEQNKRRQLRESKKQYIQNLEIALENYKSKGLISPIIKCFKQSFLNPNIINVEKVENLILTKKRQLLNVRTTDIEFLKQLFTVLKIGWCVAPEESEKLCAKLNIEGIVHAVISDDSDVIAYGAPNVLSKLNIWNENCVEVKFNKVITGLKMQDHKQFLDFCIMCGTDYNPNIYKVGSVSSYKLISEHKTIENIEKKTNLDISVLNHKRVRRLFTNFDNYPTINVPYCKIPKWEEVDIFLKKNNIPVITSDKKSVFEYNPVILEFVDTL